MARIHAFEFNDQPWLPQAWRDYMTDFLQFGANLFQACKPAIPIIVRALRAGNTGEVIDLGSGGGGGYLHLVKPLQDEVPGLTIHLTDLFPNRRALDHTQALCPQVFVPVYEPVNATQVPASLPGLRTMFMSFHHFRPEQASEILEDAVRNRMPIAIFEIQQRSLGSLIPMLLSPLNVFLTTPFIRPFRPGRLFWTYLIPVIPVMTLWDGVISVLRTYTSDEMLRMAINVPDSETYQWETGVYGKGPASILFLLGTPINIHPSDET